jgi:hypothetical protein
MAVLVGLGGVSPAEFDEMDYRDSVELARRLIEMRDAQNKLNVEYVKAILTGLGCRVH